MGRKYGVIATTHDTVGYLTNQFGSQRKFGGSYYCIAIPRDYMPARMGGYAQIKVKWLRVYVL